VKFERVFPNPVTNGATIGFAIPEAAQVQLTMHDVNGRRVATLLDTELSAGTHTIEWEMQRGQDDQFVSGVYFLRLAAGSERASAPIVIIP
jgi:hypothetical protein